jgi:hypothetical protein
LLVHCQGVFEFIYFKGVIFANPTRESSYLSSNQAQPRSPDIKAVQNYDRIAKDVLDLGSYLKYEKVLAVQTPQKGEKAICCCTVKV